MKNVPENELFSAYLDGELTADEQAQVERLLAASPAARQLMDELRALSSTLQGLPQHRLGEDLSQRVLRLAERRMLAEPAPAAIRPETAPSETALPETTPTERIDWRPILRRAFRPRNLFWPGVAVAVAIFLMMSDAGWFGPDGPDDVALAPEALHETPEETPPEILEEEAEEMPRELSRPESVAKGASPVGGSASAGETPATAMVPEDNGPEGLLSPRMPEAPPIEQPPGMPRAPGIGKAGMKAAGPAVADGLRGGMGQVTQPAPETVRQPGKASGSGGSALGLLPSSPEAEEAEPAKEVLTLWCNMSPEAARRGLVEEVLSKRNLVELKTGDPRAARRGFYAYFKTTDKKITLGSEGPSHSLEPLQVDIQATPAEILAVVADLMARPEEFRFVSDTSPLALAARGARSRNGNVDQVLRRFAAAQERLAEKVVSGRDRSVFADAHRRTSQDMRYRHGGAPAEAGPGREATLDALQPDPVPHQGPVPARPSPMDSFGAGRRQADRPERPGEPLADKPVVVELPAVALAPPAAEPGPGPDRAVAEEQPQAADAEGEPSAQRPLAPPADWAVARKNGEESENEALEGKAKLEAGGRRVRDEVDEGLPREEPQPVETPPPAEGPDRDAPTYRVRLVFQVVPADTPVAAEVRARESAGPEAAMEAAEAIEEPAAEAAPAAQE